MNNSYVSGYVNPIQVTQHFQIHTSNSDFDQIHTNRMRKFTDSVYQTAHSHIENKCASSYMQMQFCCNYFFEIFLEKAFAGFPHIFENHFPNFFNTFSIQN